MAERPKVQNAADAEAIKKDLERARDRRKQALEDVRFLLSRIEFKRFAGRLLNFCGVNASGFIGSSELYFNEGKREVGMQVVREIAEADPDAYPRMMMELRQEELRNA